MLVLNDLLLLSKDYDAVGNPVDNGTVLIHGVSGN